MWTYLAIFTVYAYITIYKSDLSVQMQSMASLKEFANCSTPEPLPGCSSDVTSTRYDRNRDRSRSPITSSSCKNKGQRPSRNSTRNIYTESKSQRSKQEAPGNSHSLTKYRPETQLCQKPVEKCLSVTQVKQRTTNGPDISKQYTKEDDPTYYITREGKLIAITNSLTDELQLQSKPSPSSSCPVKKKKYANSQVPSIKGNEHHNDVQDNVQHTQYLKSAKNVIPFNVRDPRLRKRHAEFLEQHNQDPPTCVQDVILTDYTDDDNQDPPTCVQDVILTDYTDDDNQDPPTCLQDVILTDYTDDDKQLEDVREPKPLNTEDTRLHYSASSSSCTDCKEANNTNSHTARNKFNDTRGKDSKFQRYRATPCGPRVRNRPRASHTDYRPNNLNQLPSRKRVQCDQHRKHDFNDDEVWNITNNKKAKKYLSRDERAQRLYRRRKPHTQKRNDKYGLRDLADFELIQNIGHGSYGVVFQALDKTKDIDAEHRMVALKRFQNEQGALSAVTELRIIKTLKHSNILELHEVITDRKEPIDYRTGHGVVYLMYELMTCTLADLLFSPDGHLTQAQRSGFAKQLLQGVNYCHQSNIMHRDIKSANILINHGGQLKIADFGIGRKYEGEGRPYTNQVITLWYRPPELLLGAVMYGPAVDMWSTGCVLFEIFMQQPMFHGMTDFAMIRSISRKCGTPHPAVWPDVVTLPLYNVYTPKKIYQRQLREDYCL